MPNSAPFQAIPYKGWTIHVTAGGKRVNVRTQSPDGAEIQHHDSLKAAKAAITRAVNGSTHGRRPQPCCRCGAPSQPGYPAGQGLCEECGSESPGLVDAAYPWPDGGY